MTLKEKLAKLKGEMLALKKGIEEGDADAIARGTELKGEIEEVQAKIEAAERGKSLLGFLGSVDGKGQEPMDDAAAPRTFGEAAAMARAKSGVVRGGELSFHGDVADAKAASDTQLVPIGDYAVTYSDIRPEIRTGVRRRLTISQLFKHETTDKDSITYFTEGPIEGGPAPIAENGQFPQMHVGEPEEHSATVKKIGVIYRQSDELLEDDTRLRENIDSRANYLMDVEEEDQLLNGSGLGANQKGLLTYSNLQRMTVSDIEDLLDALDDAKQGILQNTPGFDADAFVINPSDWSKLKKLKDSNGQYRAVSPFTVGPYGANNPSESGLRVWEMDPVPTPAIEAGTVIVGAWYQGGTVWDKRGGRRVDISNSDKDDFEHGRIAIRPSQREAFGVEYPLAFVVITIEDTAPDTSLSALTIGSLTLTPTFDGDTIAYSATTTSATNTITATATDSAATVSIDVNGTAVTSGGSATWESGKNTVTITVTNGMATKEYTVVVTKS